MCVFVCFLLHSLQSGFLSDTSEKDRQLVFSFHEVFKFGLKLVSVFILLLGIFLIHFALIYVNRTSIPVYSSIIHPGSISNVIGFESFIG